MNDKFQNVFLSVQNAFENFFSGANGALLKFILVALAVLSTLIIIYLYFKVEEIERKRRQISRDITAERKSMAQETKSQSEWERVLQYLETGNESEWKLAILEADNLLETLLSERGYTGEGVGDKLKVVDKAHMKTLDDAWEAHKARNRIAHDGAGARIAYREAHRVLALYERVFREFGYV